MKPTSSFLIAAALSFGGSGIAHAQSAPAFSATVGLKAWNTQWTTFGYEVVGGDSVVTQVPAEDKLVWLPQVSLRYRDFLATISAYPSTTHDFVGGGSNTRKELDLNLGYYVLPTVAVTLGYKKLSQASGPDLYELTGPVLGVAATAPLGHDFSLYGSLGFGRMKDTSASTVHFKADYRLSELGLAYTLATPGVAKAVSFTAGWRTQVLSSKEALGNQDGRDLTQGLTFGALVSF
jgi:hypothetical protein